MQYLKVNISAIKAKEMLQVVAIVLMTSRNCVAHKNMFLILTRQHISDEYDKVRNKKCRKFSLIIN